MINNNNNNIVYINKSQFGIVFMMIQGEGESTAKEFYVSRIKTQKDQKNIS